MSVRWAFNFGAWNPSEKELLLVSRCIQQEEKDRIGRFVYRKDAKASLSGRLLMRKYLHETVSLPYSKIQLGRDENGKPYLVNKLRNQNYVNFNVSHQGNFAVLAAEIGTVGVDVMKLEYSGGKSVTEFFRIMSRQFSPQEWFTIKSAGTEQDMLAMFCRHWCLKESYVKAVGTGITVDLQRISFHVVTPALKIGHVVCDTKLTVEDQHMKDWVFEESLLDSEHCVAVALKANSDNKHICSPLFQQLMLHELMKSAEPLLPEDPVYCANFLAKEERP